MAAANLCICVLMALIAGNLILAEEKNMYGNAFDFFSSILGGESREKRSADPSARAVAEDSSENQNRFFFPAFVGCNYTTEAGSTCRSCRQALHCYATNVGLLRTCRGLLPYCNNGRCSFTQGSACNNTSG